MKQSILILLLISVLYTQATYHFSGVRVVNCNYQSLENAFDRLRGGTTLALIGTCTVNAPLVVDVSGVTIKSLHDSNPASIETSQFIDILTVAEGGHLNVESVSFSGGINGVVAKDASSLSLTDVSFANQVIGLNVRASSAVSFSGTVTVSACQAFGVLVQDGSSATVTEGSNLIASGISGGFGVQIQASALTLQQNAYCETTGDLFGLHVISGSNLFADAGSLLNTSSNILLGASVNTGSNAVLFNADHTSDNNVFDGLSVSLGGTYFVDQSCTLQTNGNIRDGIRIEQGLIRLGAIPGSAEPTIFANGNGRNGISVLRQSNFDSNPAGNVIGVFANGNGFAGPPFAAVDILVDFNSGYISKGTVAGKLKLTFGSIADFVSDNVINTFECDSQSMSRGEYNC